VSDGKGGETRKKRLELSEMISIGINVHIEKELAMRETGN